MNETQKKLTNQLLDNWGSRNRLAGQLAHAEHERDMLIVQAYENGIPMTDILLASGVSRATAWRIIRRSRDEKKAEADDVWLIERQGETFGPVPESGLRDELQDLLFDRFDALQSTDDDMIPAADWDDEERLTEDQRKLRDDLERLLLRVQAADAETTEIESAELGIRVRRNSRG